LRVAMTLASWTRQHGVADAPTLVTGLDREQGFARALVSWEPDLFWEAEEQLRGPLGFPPFGTIINVDVPDDAPRLELPQQLGRVVTRELGRGIRRHQVRTTDRVGAARAIQEILARWSADGVSDLRVDVEPVDVD
ncbi:MAG: hypothetical protein R3249_01615, partial [Nitriliruptorales bacterium]|nr:hypothetical protein [Nitriliruptorales bacterium]